VRAPPDIPKDTGLPAASSRAAAASGFVLSEHRGEALSPLSQVHHGPPKNLSKILLFEVI
jgi:hypothetical protein